MRYSKTREERPKKGAKGGYYQARCTRCGNSQVTHKSVKMDDPIMKCPVRGCDGRFSTYAETPD